MKHLAVTVALALYAIVATYQWWTAEPELTVQVLEAQVEQTNKAIEQAGADQRGVLDDGNKATAQVKTVFVPIKEKVTDVQIQYRCDDPGLGEFPASVQDGLAQAVAAANGGLPAAADR